MRRTAIFTIFIVLLVSISGCAADSARTKAKDISRAKSESASHMKGEESIVQQVDGLPLLLVFTTYNDEHTEVVKERALLCYWDVETGRISIGKLPFPKEALASNPISKMFAETSGITNKDGTIHLYADKTRNAATDASQQGEVTVVTGRPEGEVKTLTFSLTLPSKAAGLYPLLVSGSPIDFIALVGYDDYSKDRLTGFFLVGHYKESDMKWREVEGRNSSLIYAYTPDVIKVGDRIYIDGKDNLTVKAIDIKSDPLELVDYAPANKLIRQIDAPEPSPPGFGSYQDILLISVYGNYKTWIWALRDDACIGKVCFDLEEKRLVSYKDDKIIDEEHLTELPSAIRLPR